VVKKDASGNDCTDCTGSLAATLGGVAADAVDCIAGTAFCDITWSSVTTAGSQQLSITLEGTAISGSPYAVTVAAGEDSQPHFS
jgi:hypothetical protein